LGREDNKKKVTKHPIRRLKEEESVRQGGREPGE